MIRLEIPIDNSSKTRKVDITILDRNHNGKVINNFVRSQMAVYPALKPLFYVIKTLSCHFKLTDPKNGGIRTYAIIVMLLSFIAKWNENTLGKLLLDFLYYFGFYYEYSYDLYSSEMTNDVESLENVNTPF
jgi:DNA polymerase sigma